MDTKTSLGGFHVGLDPRKYLGLGVRSGKHNIGTSAGIDASIHVGYSYNNLAPSGPT